MLASAADLSGQDTQDQSPGDNGQGEVIPSGASAPDPTALKDPIDSIESDVVASSVADGTFEIKLEVDEPDDEEAPLQPTLPAVVSPPRAQVLSPLSPSRSKSQSSYGYDTSNPAGTSSTMEPSLSDGGASTGPSSSQAVKEEMDDGEESGQDAIRGSDVILPQWDFVETDSNDDPVLHVVCAQGPSTPQDSDEAGLATPASFGGGGFSILSVSSTAGGGAEHGQEQSGEGRHEGDPLCPSGGSVRRFIRCGGKRTGTPTTATTATDAAEEPAQRTSVPTTATTATDAAEAPAQRTSTPTTTATTGASATASPTDEVDPVPSTSR